MRIWERIKTGWRSAGRMMGRAIAAIDTTRRVGTSLFLLVSIGLGLWLVLVAGKPRVEDGSVLVMALKGPLVDEDTAGWRDRLAAQLQGRDSGKVSLRDFSETLDRAAGDDRIRQVLLKLDDFEGGGLASLREAAAAIERFKASGKPVLAWSGRYDQRQYYLAAHASEVLLHPMGTVLIEGLGRPRNYYKDALDKLGVRAHLIRAGTFKSAGEPFVRNAPSPEALQADAQVYDALWSLYTEGVERARQLPAGSINARIDSLPGALQAVQGNTARMALEWKWVDGLQTFEALRQRLIDAVGQHEDGTTFRQTPWQTYLAATREAVKGEHIAVIVAQGEIGEGQAGAGQIGGESTARRIREVAADPNVKALVLRVNSPGGSAYGSELVRDQLRLMREAGKPVVVSMGDVAASGGYWIAMAADRIVADPATITGSIGVFALLPTAEGLMGKLGVNTGGHRTTWLAGAYDPRQPLEPRMQALVQSAVGHIYDDFLAKTAQARQLQVPAVDAVAQGRIWTGAQALGHRLVDRTGSLRDAIEEARRLVPQGDQLPVRYASRKQAPAEQLLQRLLPLGSAGESAPWTSSLQSAAAWAGLPFASPPAWLQAQDDLLWLQSLATASAPVPLAHCLCDIRP